MSGNRRPVFCSLTAKIFTTNISASWKQLPLHLGFPHMTLRMVTSLRCLVQTLLLFGILSFIAAGLELYDHDTEICCSGTVHKTVDFAEGDVHCCNQMAYNSRTHICCYDVVSPRPDAAAATIGCCGSVAYIDTPTNICCGGIVVDVTEDNFTLHLLGGKSNVACCDGMIYDLLSDMCCDDGPRPRPFGSAECCGDEVYDSASEVCCQKTVRPTQRHKIFCCGDQAYDAVSSLCCDGAVHVKPDIRTSDDEGDGGAIVACCGTKTMDVEKQMCCDGHAVPSTMSSSSMRCCGNSSYDPDTELCCDGVPLRAIVADDNNLSHPACCGSQLYSRDNQVCCNGTVHEADSYNAICCGRDLLADTTFYMCCDGKTLARYSSHTRCCGSVTYENDRQLCCRGNTVRPRLSNDERCCGDSVYQFRQQVCCLENGSHHILPLDNLGRTSCCVRDQ